MRKVKYLFLPILLAAFVACATFDKNAFTTLGVAKTAYTQGMSALGDLQRQGKLSDADVQKILPVARIYYQAYLVAESAYEVYHANPTVANQDQLIALLNDAAAKLGQLSAILTQYNVAVTQFTVPAK